MPKITIEKIEEFFKSGKYHIYTRRTINKYKNNLSKNSWTYEEKTAFRRAIALDNTESEKVFTEDLIKLFKDAGANKKLAKEYTIKAKEKGNSYRDFSVIEAAKEYVFIIKLSTKCKSSCIEYISDYLLYVEHKLGTKDFVGELCRVTDDNNYILHKLPKSHAIVVGFDDLHTYVLRSITNISTGKIIITGVVPKDCIEIVIYYILNKDTLLN